MVISQVLSFPRIFPGRASEPLPEPPEGNEKSKAATSFGKMPLESPARNIAEVPLPNWRLFNGLAFPQDASARTPNLALLTGCRRFLFGDVEESFAIPNKLTATNRGNALEHLGQIEGRERVCIFV
mmetsp:Transcript_5842/g.9058  ORF Transcript_5842/g.9058 Transcript_5842/m.9058 type:complete len:126 (+) Transcript_5842:617-994(+)